MSDKLLRTMPLAGIGYAILQAAGDLTIGQFPRGDSAPEQLAAYYAGHHAAVRLGGTLMAVAAVFLALFGASLAARLREGASNRLIAAVVLIGTALTTMTAIQSAGTYMLLGLFATNRAITPAALQAWHLAGSEFAVGADIAILLIGVFAATVIGKAVPAWLGWTGLVIAVAQFTPLAFLASLLFILWAAIASVALATRPSPVTLAPASSQIPLPA